MSLTAPGRILYTRSGRLYILKLTGEVRYPLSPAFDAFLARIFAEQGFDDVVIDLAEASCIDSTNLGLLAKIALYTTNRLGHKSVIVSPNPDITEVLESMGFEHVFTIVDSLDAVAGEGTPSMQALSDQGTDEQDLARILLDAHQVLSGLNEENREQFKDVVGFLQNRAKPAGAEGP